MTLLRFLPFLQSYHELLRCVASDGRHAGRPLRYDVQCIGGAVGEMAIRALHVRRVEQFGRLFLYRQYSAPLLYLGRQVCISFNPINSPRKAFDRLSLPHSLLLAQILCYLSTARISTLHDSKDCRADDCQRMVPSRTHLLHAHFLGMVHDGRAFGVAQGESQRMHFRRKQDLCCRVKFNIVLDSRHCHDHDVLSYIQVNIASPSTDYVSRRLRRRLV